MNQEKVELLKKKIKRRELYNKKLDKEIKDIRRELAIGCTHPEEMVSEFDWEWDNGYGTQRKKKGFLCSVCFRKNHWKSDGSWSNENWAHQNLMSD